MSEKDQKSVLNTKCSRRNFLRGSAAVAATLSVGSVLKSCATPPAAAVAQPDPLLRDLNDVALRHLRSPVNDMGLAIPENPAFKGEPFYYDPIWNVASGADPLWNEFKKETIIGDFHWTPREAFLLAFPQETAVRAEELSVLVFGLPMTQASREDNRRERLIGSERFARTRWLAEAPVVHGLMRNLVDELAAQNIQAVAPTIMPGFTRDIPSRFGYSSTWSLRHAGFVAGMGTFGLQDALISRVGASHRMGSVILRAPMQVTPRTYTSSHEWCLFFKDGSCGICVSRCPVGSVRFEGRDKGPCMNQLRVTITNHAEANWGFRGYGCGLCNTGVLCESRIPPGIVV